LQIAGYEPAAKALHHLAREIKRFSLIEVSWSADDDDSYTLDIDVEGAYERVTDELRRAEQTPISRPADADLAVLIEAANLADSLTFLAHDYLLYFEGWMPAGYDPGESDEQRMQQVQDEHDGLLPERVVQKCNSHGYSEVSSALDRLVALTSTIVHLPPSAYPAERLSRSFLELRVGDDGEPGKAIDTDQERDQIDSAHDSVISATVAERDKLGAP
jgi:hypothetical protein